LLEEVVGDLRSTLWIVSGATAVLLLIACINVANLLLAEVDQYPLFKDCDETVVKQEQRACFEQTLLHHFSQTLEGFEFLMADDVEDTLYMDFLVDLEGTITVLDIEQNREVADQIPEFNGVITQSLKSLPPVAPALKRGIPVNAKFRIPLILNTN
jgi:hypothetical protein